MKKFAIALAATALIFVGFCSFTTPSASANPYHHSALECGRHPSCGRPVVKHRRNYKNSWWYKLDQLMHNLAMENQAA